MNENQLNCNKIKRKVFKEITILNNKEGRRNQVRLCRIKKWKKMWQEKER